MLKYKDYIGHVVFDEDAEIFHGEVINTHDVITFQGELKLNDSDLYYLNYILEEAEIVD